MSDFVYSFIWKGEQITVKRNKDGTIVYRYAEHLGGPWSDANKTLANPSIDSKFKSYLRTGIRVLNDSLLK